MSDFEFPCTFCGSCCSHVDKAIKNAKNSNHPIWKDCGENFPYNYDSNGKCEKLINGKCSVYEQRPLLCNINELGKLLNFDLKIWHYMIAKSCNQLIDQDNLSSEYKINTDTILN
jgi:Fe-S-cluster containining protein